MDPYEFSQSSSEGQADSTSFRPLYFTPATTTTDISQAPGRYSGLYTSTGLDVLSVLSRVVNRPNPEINVGPVDLSTAFLVVDAQAQFDFPIIYASPTFEQLTGYPGREIVGRNCRFLQSPDGNVAQGSRRKFTDNNTVHVIRQDIIEGKETQSSLINYKRSGQPFVNLLTVVPVLSKESNQIEYFVGFQIDLAEQPEAIIQSMKESCTAALACHGIPDGTYMVNYRRLMLSPALGPNPRFEETQKRSPAWHDWTSLAPPPEAEESTATTHTELPPVDVERLIRDAATPDSRAKRLCEEMLLDEYPDFLHVLTVRGVFLYCSKAVRCVLGYNPEELEGEFLQTICHPADITTVLRELKSAVPGETIDMVYRIRRKNSEYVWLQCRGRVHYEDTRGRKYVVLSGRERAVYRLTAGVLSLGSRLLGPSSRRPGAAPGGGGAALDDREMWCKLSLEGLVLYASWTCIKILGCAPTDLVGTSLYQYFRSDRTTDLASAFAIVNEGKIVHLQHALVTWNGQETMVASTFYPDGSLNPTNRMPSFVLMQTRVMEEKVGQDQELMLISLDPFAKRKTSTTESGEGSSGQQQQPLAAPEDALFPEFHAQCMTNWEYELYQLRIANRQLWCDLEKAIAERGGSQARRP